LIGVMARLSSRRKLSAHSLDIDIEERDPVHQAAREVVGALVENHWSLHAAALVVALRRLCEAAADRAVECLTLWSLTSEVSCRAQRLIQPRSLGDCRTLSLLCASERLGSRPARDTAALASHRRQALRRAPGLLDSLRDTNKRKGR
jgi:hypothetical protein